MLPPTRKVPCCTSCWLTTDEHKKRWNSRCYYARTDSQWETIPWVADAPTRLCWLCRCPTDSGLLIDPIGLRRRVMRPFRSLARLRLRKAST